MKNWILIFLLSITNVYQVLSCGPYYPYGEDVRYNLLKPRYVDLKGMNQFNYTALLYAFDSEGSIEELAETDENTSLWFDYLKEKVNRKDIYSAVYILTTRDLKNSSSQNKMVQMIHQPEYKGVLKYLLFAKYCSPMNMQFSDPWERESKMELKSRKKAIRMALKYAEASTDQELTRRYAYIAIRLSFYNSDESSINKIYEKYFKDKTTLDALDYWVLHFKLQFTPNSPRKNVDIATVFAHSREKRYAVQFLYDRNIDVNSSLSVANTDDEKASLTLLETVLYSGHSFEEIKSYAKYSEKDEELSFLILREINKLEDWILTPHYSLFTPSLESGSLDASNKASVAARVQKDREYASHLADWMDDYDESELEQEAWWGTMINYLRFLANETNSLLPKVNLIINKSQNNVELLNFNKMLYSLLVLHNSGNPDLSDLVVQQTLMNETSRNNNKFLFAIARELEYKGNTSEAAMILSQLNRAGNWEDYSYWRTQQFHTTLYNDFYENYFFYMDAQYSTDELSNLIEVLERSKVITSFDEWKLEIIKEDLPRFYDLLGTKQIRKDNLELALKAFEKVEDTLWQSKNYPFKEYLNSNPFYTNFHNEHSFSKGDTVHYTKTEITKKLMHYIRMSDQEIGNKKAYYCFQVANCYFNMTQHGNSWMMRRYFWTANETYTGLIDDKEYFQCTLAKKYYLEAQRSTNNDKIAALALRMAGRCEQYRLYDISRDDYDENLKNDLFKKNKFYNLLKEKYPDHYEPLISNCESFEKYYAFVK